MGIESLSILLFLVFGAAAIIFTVAKQKKWNELFSNLAARHGLTFSRSGFFSSPSVSGMIGDVDVDVYIKNFSHGKSSTRTIAFRFQFPASSRTLAVTPDGFFRRLTQLGGSRDIELADREFDEAALISGESTAAARALLHPAARRIILGLINASYAKKFSLEYGLLETYQKANRFSGVDDLSVEIMSIVRLGTFLARKGGDELLLRENYSAETDPRCQAAYLESIIQIAGRLSPEDAAITTALSSGDPPLEFLAAKAIGPEGEGYIPDLFRRADPGLALRILEYLEERRAIHLIPRLLSLPRAVDDWRVKGALARFAAGAGVEEAESYILKLLESEPAGPGDFKKECIRGLGRCGGKASIQFLHHLKGVLIRRDADEAIASIRARLGLKETGMLSVPEPEPDKGGLSLADDERSAGGKSKERPRKTMKQRRPGRRGAAP